MLRYENLSRSAGLKKWLSATAVADYGDSQAFWIPPLLPFALGIAVGAATLHNRSGGTVKCGLGARYPIAAWVAGQVDSAGAYTADTEDAQDAGAGDFALHDRADSGSGFLVGCTTPFNLLGIVQSAAGDQTGPTLIVEYWDGSAWQDLAASAFIADALIANGTGEKVLCFPLPSDWALGGSGTGVPATTYNLRVRNTTTGAGAADPAASQLFVGFAKMMLEGIGDNAAVALIRDHEFLFPRLADALFPVFSTAGSGNAVEVDVRAY